MSRFTVLFLSLLVTVLAINRPVYKIVLTQKGFAQFLQYDVETPPLREFTFCTWIRVYDLENPQSIFTYVANGNNRVVRLWLDSGGQSMQISINGKTTSTSRVNVVRDVWRHVCLSYQSDFGAWALYVDSRLVACEATQRLYGYVLPGGGSVIVGYGTALNGAPNGLEGEIFGVNMILQSTIERNYTIKQNPKYSQKQFKRNKLKKDTKDNGYIVLSDLLVNDMQNNYDKTVNELLNSTNLNYINVKTSHHTPHDHNADETQKDPEQEFFDFNIADFRTTVKEKFNQWESQQFKEKQDKMKQNSMKSNKHIIISNELSNAGTKGVPTVSEYETPPPPQPPSYYLDTLSTQHITPIHNDMSTFSDRFTTKQSSKNTAPELLDYETPPPVAQNNRVYGQWTSSKFAGTVLNYLKNIRFKSKMDPNRKIPPTLPLNKISDMYPYPSNLQYSRVRAPSQFQKRKLVERYYDIVKRNPQINVQIYEDDTDTRNNILKMHAQTKPKKVNIRSRGEPIKPKENRYYRDVDNYSVESEESTEAVDEYGNHNIEVYNNYINGAPIHRRIPREEIVGPRQIDSLPVINSWEILLEESQNKESQIPEANKDNMYYKSLSAKNKWHNVKTYSNDYTPNKINIIYSKESEDLQKKYYPSVRLNYVHENRKPPHDSDPSIVKARKLAKEVSHQSNTDNSVSILKYNHGYLENQEKIKIENIFSPPKLAPSSKRNMKDHNEFNKPVKIGNALNERALVGDNESEKKHSFVGGNDDIPDINRYRSDIDQTSARVPPSLGPRVCKNVELCDRVLYVQKDESIDMTHIVSPMRIKNFAIEFVMQNYKKCSLTDSPFQQNELLLIDWNKTPVRLFGGAHPKTTTDLCGFF